MKLNQYEWDPQTDKIGSGAFAEVFKATDQRGDPVALKVYTEAVIKSSTSGSYKGRYTLENEFSKGRDLSHTNIIRYIGLDYIVHTDVMQRELSYPVLIMEYADGGSLEGWLKSSFPPGINEALKVITGIFRGLDYLHDQGIIHRDLKPANILFKSDRKGNKVPKIGDFGISRDVLEENVNSISSTTGVGTTGYMAPEQFLNKTFGLNGTVSNRTDIWAAGVILYRMLTGKLPFGGGDNQSYEVLLEEVTQKEPDYTIIPAKYEPLIKGCLQKKAINRFADAAAALKELDTTTATPPPDDPNGTIVVPREAAPKFSQPNPVRPPAPPPPTPVNNKTIAIIAVSVIIAAIAFYFIFRRHGTPHPYPSYGADSTKMDSAKMTDTTLKMADTGKMMAVSKSMIDTSKSSTKNGTYADVKKRKDSTIPMRNTNVKGELVKSLSFLDLFNDNSNNWPITADSTKIIRIADRQLTIQGLSNNFSYRCLKYFDLNLDNDFSAAILAKWVNGGTNNDFGMTFGSDLSSGTEYRFDITEDGYYTIFYKENNSDWKNIKELTKSNYIKIANGKNILQIICHGTNISFFINNKQVEFFHFNKVLGHNFGVNSSGVETIDFGYFYLRGNKY